jgi:ribosomal protein S18 acetylase RimI-like enzyme
VNPGGLTANLSVRPAEEADRPAIDASYQRTWGGPTVATSERLYDLRYLPTLVVVDATDETLLGVLTYEIAGDAIEVVSIEATTPHSGAGSARLAAAVEVGRASRLGRLWLVSTNDNLDGLRFYQRRGLRIEAIRPGAIAAARQRKPTIPEIGAYGIPLRDEIVLSMPLAPSALGDG